MSDDKPARRPENSTYHNGIPSAMDELQFRRVLRDFGNIEAKGLQQRATASEIGLVAEHIMEICLHNAITASRMRDIAEKELIREDYERFDTMLSEIEQEIHHGQIEGVRTTARQLNDNIRQQPIETAAQNKRDDRVTFGKKILLSLGYEETPDKGKR